MSRSIEQIDRDIDANRRALIARLHFDPGMSCHNWQHAWDRCPDLLKRERTLCCERYGVQVERDRQAELEHRRQQRAERARLRKSAPKQCPTCGSFTLAA